MLVDDSRAVRLKLKNILVELGHEIVAELSDGALLVREFEKYRPDVVTLDVVMPEMNGLTALEEIRKHHPDARVVMVTSAATVSNMMKAKSLGALHFITKPFRREKVEAVFRDLGHEKLPKEDAA